MINTDATSDATSGSIERSPTGDAPETLSPPARSTAAEAVEAAPPAEPAAPRRPRVRRSKSGVRKQADQPAAEQTPETGAAEEARPDPDAQGLPSRKPRRRSSRRSVAPAVEGDRPAAAAAPLPTAAPVPAADREQPLSAGDEADPGQDASVPEGPFTFADEADEEAPATGKRRRSRRGGRGRKRAVPPAEARDAAPDGMSGGTPGSGEDAMGDSGAARGETPAVPPDMEPAAIDPEQAARPAARAAHGDSGEGAASPVLPGPDAASTLPGQDEEAAPYAHAVAESDAAWTSALSETDDAAGEEAVAARKKGRVREKAEAESTARLPPRGLMKMLISVLPGDEVEVVLTEDGKVREYYVEMMHHAKIRGNIYKGVISNVDANLQAAFVNYGAVKNGFLQIDEVHPDYYLQPHEAGKGHKYPPIQKVLKAGQEVLVQVVKEPNGSKGAFLTTWISLAGRFLVLTPGQEEIGISRKVEDAAERNRLRELIKGLNPGQGMGAIVRTVSAGTSKTTLQKDLSYLKRLWKDIRKRGATEKAPALIHREPGLASRAVRDYLADDITEVWVDDEETAVSIRETAGLLFPRKTDLVRLYADKRETLWEHFGILKQLEQVHAREVYMPSGGRLVFDQTEALMAIDINSGRISGKNNFEAMAFRTNMEAATTIAEQLRLRDIGGQIVIDFIEMRDQEHCREVEKTLRNAMRWDRARHDIGKMSSFGLLQIVRQRTGSSAISITLEPCPHCGGTGQRRNLEWRAVQTLRDLQRAVRAAAANGQGVCVHAVDPELGLYLLNHKRERLTRLEQQFGIVVEVRMAGFAEAAGSGQPVHAGQNAGARGVQNQPAQQGKGADKPASAEKENRQSRKSGKRGKTGKSVPQSGGAEPESTAAAETAPAVTAATEDAPLPEPALLPPSGEAASVERIEQGAASAPERPGAEASAPAPAEPDRGASFPPEDATGTGPQAERQPEAPEKTAAVETPRRAAALDSARARSGRRSSGGRPRKPRPPAGQDALPAEGAGEGTGAEGAANQTTGAASAVETEEVS